MLEPAGFGEHGGTTTTKTLILITLTPTLTLILITLTLTLALTLSLTLTLTRLTRGQPAQLRLRRGAGDPRVAGRRRLALCSLQQPTRQR